MTLKEMLNKEAHHHEDMDEGAEIYVDDAIRLFKEWLKEVGLPDYYVIDRDGNGLYATGSLRQLIIVLVDEL